MSHAKTLLVVLAALLALGTACAAAAVLETDSDGRAIVTEPDIG
jgi:uncharacterized protein involved in exopolysaccharide biosynthesis